MRKQEPHDAARRDDVPGDDLPDCFPGRGLCCPDDPLDLVIQFFPAPAPAPADDRAPPSSLAALGIGGDGDGAGAGAEPPRQEQEQEKPLAESAFGGGGGWDDSWGLSSCVLEGLRGLDEIDVDMFFADDALDGGGGEDTQGNLLCDPTELETKPKPPAHLEAAGGGPVHVHTRGSLGGGAVPNDDAPTPASALQAFGACRAFDAAVFKNASPTAAAAPMPAGGPLPVFVTNNSTPPLPALMPAAAAPMPAGVPPPVVVTNNGKPPLLALMPPAALAPMPQAATMSAGGPPPVFVTNNSAPPMPALMPAALAPIPMAPAAPAPMSAAGLHACGMLPGIVSNGAPAPPPLMAPMPSSPLIVPTRALHPNATLAGVYSSSNKAPAHSSPSATPSASPPSGAFSGSGRSPSSTTSSEPEFLHPHHAWVIVPTKQRSPPAFNRRKRPWQLDFPLHALPPVALALAPPPANPVGGGGGGGDAKNRYAVVPFALAPPPGGNTGGGNDIAAVSGGGGVRRRRPAPRQRNRQAQRVCSHCHSPETPQWRAGPDGPGTLCNACGIRYAANRLLPEYRPSTAPSFQSGQHSNRHRKVMKLREQQMKAKEEKPPSEQRPMEDGADEKDDLVRLFPAGAGSGWK